jgi:hypothetical protein
MVERQKNEERPNVPESETLLRRGMRTIVGLMRGTCGTIRDLLADKPGKSETDTPSDPARFAPRTHLLLNETKKNLAKLPNMSEDARDTVLDSVFDPQATGRQIVERAKRVLEIMDERYSDVPGTMMLADFRSMITEESSFSRLLGDALKSEHLRTATVEQWLRAMRAMARRNVR